MAARKLYWLLVLASVSLWHPALAAERSLTPDVIYGHKAGMALTFDVIRPAEQNGAGVLFMVSGGWVSTWFPPEALVAETNPFGRQFIELADHGYTVFLVRHGSSPYFKVPDAVNDVRQAVRFIRLHAADYGIDSDRLGVFGGSAGGHLSLMLGTTGDDGQKDAAVPLEKTSDRVQAVVALFPPTKIDEFFPLQERFPALKFDAALAESVSPLLQVTSDDAPTLLIHGDEDKLVPISNSERILKKFEEEDVPAKLITIEGAAHGFQGDDLRESQQATLEWFEKYLGKPAEK